MAAQEMPLVGYQPQLLKRDEASPQQAAGYQEENLFRMRNHGFSNSSL